MEKKKIPKSLSSDPFFKGCFLSWNVKPLTFQAPGERFPNAYLAHLLFQKPWYSLHFFAASFDLNQDSETKVYATPKKTENFFHVPHQTTKVVWLSTFFLDPVINKNSQDTMID